MRKIIIVGGITAFGKTILGALIEKLGATYVPMQDGLIEDYIRGRFTLQDRTHLRKIMEFYADRYGRAIPRLSGISFSAPMVSDAIIDGPLFRQKLDLLDQREFTNFQDLWFAYRNAFAESVLYKEIKTSLDTHVLIPGTLEYDEPKYRELFDDVRFIYIRREFHSWLNSKMASEQNYYRRYQKEKDRGRRPRSVIRYALKLRPYSLIEDYLRYEESLSRTPSMKFDFNDLFNGHAIEALPKLASYLELPLPKQDLTKELFDVHGHITNYEQAFTQFDDAKTFISKITHKLYALVYRKHRPMKLVTPLAKILFIVDYYRASGWSHLRDKGAS